MPLALSPEKVALAHSHSVNSSTETSSTQGQRPVAPPLWSLAVMVAVSVVGLTLLTPALPLVQQDLGTSDVSVQQLLTLYLVALAVGQLIYGTVSDRYGRRPVLIFGSLLFTVAGFASVLATTVDALALFRVVQGLGAAACMAMGRAIINDCFVRADAARHMSTVASMLAIAPTLSLAFGGMLAELAGWRGIMIVTAISGLLVLALAVFHTTETNVNPTKSIQFAALKEAYHSVLIRPVFVCFALCSGLQVGMFFAMNGFMPFQYQRHGYSAVEFGFWFSMTSLFYLLGNNANRLYFVSRGIENAAMIGCALSLLSVLLLYFTQAWGFTHALSLAVPCALFGFSNGIIVANTTIGAISAAGRHAGTGTGITGAWQMAAGGISGALIVGAGGAQNFQIAAIGLILMSTMSIAAMSYVYKKQDAQI